MGDLFQNLVAPDVDAAHAEAEGHRLLAWLIAEEIVSAELTDCVLGEEFGPPPGRQYAKATRGEWPLLFDLWTNGLAVITKKNVYHSGQGGFELICRTCGSRFATLDAWGDAVDAWYKQIGLGELRCPACGVSRSVIDWQYDPPWGFGELGFEFWNWPELVPAFINEFQRQLGSRIVYVHGRL